MWRPSTNRIHGSAAPAPSKIPKTTLGEASSRNLQTLTSVLLRHSVSPLAIESTQGLVGCLLPMQARRHVKQAGADLQGGLRGLQPPLLPKTPWKIEVRKREKKRKERREEEERGAGGRRREMSPPKDKSWIRHCKQATLYGKKSSLATVRMEKKI